MPATLPDTRRDLAAAGILLERVQAQLARAVRRHRTLDVATLAWLERQLEEATALVRAGWERED